MGESTTLLAGVDVHKDSSDIGLCEAGRGSEVRNLGTVAGGVEAVTKALRRQFTGGKRLRIVHEAGPCGLVLARHFAVLGWHCEVVAPSSIPRAPGKRTKTDRRDALKLRRLALDGALAVVRVPDPADEALRDVVRAPERGAVREQRSARHRLKALLLPQRYPLCRPQFLDRGAPALPGQPATDLPSPNRSPSRSTCKPSAKLARALSGGSRRCAACS